jgi:hypothetical protein
MLVIAVEVLTAVNRHDPTSEPRTDRVFTNEDDPRMSRQIDEGQRAPVRRIADLFAHDRDGRLPHRALPDPREDRRTRWRNKWGEGRGAGRLNATCRVSSI